MYEFSRAIYRELAGEIIEDPESARQNTNHERVLRACEATVERLATDRNYFARPARTLFCDIRTYFPNDIAAAGAARHRTFPGVGRRVLAPFAEERIRRQRETAAMSLSHTEGHAVPADAVGPQRLLPLSPAPRDH
jgi:hypothetical protein